MKIILKRLRLISGMALLFTFAQCTAPRVVHFTNETNLEEKINTFHIENLKLEKDPEMLKAPLIVEIEDAILTELLKRGYVESKENADIKVRYEIIANQVTNYTINPNPYRIQTIYNQSIWNNNVFNMRTFTESVLLIEINNYSSGNIIWQGSLDMKYSQKTKETKNIVKNAVALIFETYPFGVNE